MHTAAMLIPLVLLVLAAVVDLRTREVPDWISWALLAVAILAAGLGLANVRWWMVATGGLLGLGLGLALFHLAGLGGGDAKLLVGLGAFLGPVGLLFLLFWMAVFGGLLAMVAAIRGHRDYAYVPAIAAGFAAYLIYPGGLWSRLFSGW